MKIVIALHHPFILWNAPEWLIARLRSDFPEHSFFQTATYEELGAAIVDADVLLGWTIRPEQFAKARRLRWIHSPAAAVHQLMFPALSASAVQVTNSRNVHAPVVAEHVIALLHALAKRLPQARDFQHQAIWAQQLIFDQRPTIREIEGSTLCIVGLGSIGRQVALRARALGMKVIAVREHPERGLDGADEVFGRTQLHAALRAADFVVLCAPVTPGTQHIINAAALDAMRPDAYLINVGRGPLIDNAALISALREERIAGAALDVFDEEPLPAVSPYWGLANVLITPHTAAVTPRLWERQYALIAKNLRLFLAGSSLVGLVDKSKGY